MITVVGVVFSIMIVTLTLASTQFGPRMLRNFIRDRRTQLTLGTFVATFVYATLVLVSIPGPSATAASSSRTCRFVAAATRLAGAETPGTLELEASDEIDEIEQ